MEASWGTLYWALPSEICELRINFTEKVTSCFNIYCWTFSGCSPDIFTIQKFPMLFYFMCSI